jgi:hypothetical protein
MVKHANGHMKPLVVKMPSWLLDEAKKKADADNRTLSAYVRLLVMRDCSATGRRRRIAAA